MKRLLDFGIALIGCTILTPVFLALAFLVARESPGGAIYRQERIGKNGRPFFLLKFRSTLASRLFGLAIFFVAR